MADFGVALRTSAGLVNIFDVETPQLAGVVSIALTEFAGDVVTIPYPVDYVSGGVSSVIRADRTWSNVDDALPFARHPFWVIRVDDVAREVTVENDFDAVNGTVVLEFYFFS